MDKEKLFAELCAQAPDMPSNWAPEGEKRLPHVLDITVGFAEDEYARVTGKPQFKTYKTPRAAGYALAGWYIQHRKTQAQGFLQHWRVAYAREITAAAGLE